MANDGQMTEGGFLTLTAYEAIAANLLVSAHTTAGQVALCGAGGFPIAVADEAVAASAVAGFRPLKTSKRILVKASAAIAAGDFVKAAAAGKVAPEATVTTRTAATIGQADTAASADGSLFWMYPL